MQGSQKSPETSVLLIKKSKKARQWLIKAPGDLLSRASDLVLKNISYDVFVFTKKHSSGVCFFYTEALSKVSRQNLFLPLSRDLSFILVELVGKINKNQQLH